MKTKCYLLKVESLISISDKAVKACCFDGSKDILPKSQIFGETYGGKSKGYWVAAWILEKKNLQYSSKKIKWYNPVTKKLTPHVEITKHIPDKIEPKENKPDATLIR